MQVSIRVKIEGFREDVRSFDPRSFWIVVLWKSGIRDVENGDLTIHNGVISPVNMESLLIQSTIRVGFGEILVLTMVYTTGGSWKSIG